MSIIIKDLGTKNYEAVWEQMKDYTLHRTQENPDQIWLVEHPPVFTQGQAGKPEHILLKSDIPVVQSDRGGQVTYHAPGQLVAYTLVNLRRAKLSVRGLVCLLEKSVIALLNTYGIKAVSRKEAPGVYVEDQKICSLGLRIKRGYSYHGLALNVDMDLSPFEYINPCGIARLSMTDIKSHIASVTMSDVKTKLIEILTEKLHYSGDEINFMDE